MEDCNLSLAVDCTLSLGSATSRGEIPARLSRAGSPDQDLTWSLAVRSDPSRAHTCEQDPGTEQQAMSWRGSCDRSSDPGVSLDYFPQVSGTEGRGSDCGPSKGAWPSAHRSCKDGATTSKAALLSMIKSSRASRQPWLSHYIPPSSAKGAASQCIDTFVRVCAHCGTSKTPLWRNGPGGPKSLCNACGIRFKKAGRRSAANGSSESPPASPSPRGSKREVADEVEHFWVFPPDARPRKRSSGALLSGSCMTWQGEKHSSYSSDEEEGAVLLMALSCGVVNA